MRKAGALAIGGLIALGGLLQSGPRYCPLPVRAFVAAEPPPVSRSAVEARKTPDPRATAAGVTRAAVDPPARGRRTSERRHEDAVRRR